MQRLVSLGLLLVGGSMAASLDLGANRATYCQTVAKKSISGAASVVCKIESKEFDMITAAAGTLDGVTSISIAKNANLLTVSLSPIASLELITVVDNPKLTNLGSFAGMTSMDTFYFTNNDAFDGSLPTLDKTVKLKTLSITNNAILMSIPALDALTLLHDLTIKNNGKITSIPSLANSKDLFSLIIEDNAELTSIPSLSANTKLHDLSIKKNGKLATIPSLDGLSSLQSLSLSDNTALTAFPSIKGTSSLLEFIGESNPVVTTGPDFSGSPKLIAATIKGNAKMTSMPPISGLNNLESLTVEGNPLLASLTVDGNPALSSLAVGDNAKLASLTVSNNPALTELDLSKPLPALTELSVANLGLTELSVPGASVPKLRKLTVADNAKLASMGPLSGLASLESATFSNNDMLAALPEMSGLSALKTLEVKGNGALASFPELSGAAFPALESLYIVDNGAVRSLPSFGSLSTLKTLVITDNESLHEVGTLTGLGGLDVLTIQRNHLAHGKPTTLSGLDTFSEGSSKLSSLSLSEVCTEAVSGGSKQTAFTGPEKTTTRRRLASADVPGCQELSEGRQTCGMCVRHRCSRWGENKCASRFYFDDPQGEQLAQCRCACCSQQCLEEKACSIALKDELVARVANGALARTKQEKAGSYATGVAAFGLSAVLALALVKAVSARRTKAYAPQVDETAH